MEIFCKNSLKVKAVNYFGKKAASQMFDWVLNTTQTGLSFVPPFYLVRLQIEAIPQTCSAKKVFLEIS